ncbi:NADP-dependent oxidoreductase [Alteribacter keqinensis]|uniref:NADP-dependent oxidoreductase n=1 Tax=Alteribacter keqinensis TaxID=2483800 RepID=A0A3M7U1C1_9BACI|nr:NADP-dependent oxidoreductase [Alteribacter keqinensis]RNA70465.1 NADP-dependent oxidoreductase [Alteribacter keqinensis]
MNTQHQITLAKRPEGLPGQEHFSFEKTDVPSPQKGEVLIQSIYISVDPYMRGRMEDTKSYVEPFQVGRVIDGGVVGKVVESESDKFSKGDYVIGHLGWKEYSTARESIIRKVDKNLAPLSAYLGVLGMPGLTAYFGMTDIGQPEDGETVVISGAAGAVGMIAGQIAKVHGAKVIGIAGSDEKVSLLKEDAGFDEAINYKTTSDIHTALREACPNGVDVYFDNVGGEISDAVYPLLNDFARIPQCGAISSYNKGGDDVGPRIQTYMIKARVRLQGFIVSDYADRFDEGAKQLGMWLQEGKLTYKETINEGFDKIPDAFLGLFSGENTGKQLIKVAEE